MSSTPGRKLIDGKLGHLRRSQKYLLFFERSIIDVACGLPVLRCDRCVSLEGDGLHGHDSLFWEMLHDYVSLESRRSKACNCYSLSQMQEVARLSFFIAMGRVHKPILFSLYCLLTCVLLEEEGFWNIGSL